MKALLRKPVRVVWLDATNGQGWFDLAQLADEQPEEIISVGFLVHADKERVVLTTSISGDEGLGWVAIPAKWIKDVSVLTVAETAKEAKRRTKAPVHEIPAE